MNTKKVVKIVAAILFWGVICYLASDILLGGWSTRSGRDIALFAGITVFVWLIGDCAIIDWIKNDLFKKLRLESLECTRNALLTEISDLEYETENGGHTEEIDTRILKFQNELDAVNAEIASLSLPIEVTKPYFFN